MARLTIYKDNYVDSTVVSNRFIDEYMKDANDAQLKIYLYLIRMLYANQATNVSDIADKFNHTEKDVTRALKYWEKLGLLNLEYDDDKNMIGIHLRDLNKSNNSVKMCNVSLESGELPKPNVHQVPSASPAYSTSIEESSTQDAPLFSKPVFSPDQLREFKNRESTAQLIFIAESYIAKPLTPAEMKSIMFFSDVLHFSDDLIDYLIQYCVDRGKKDFKYIEKVAINWAEEGITTPKQAQKFSSRYDKNVYAIMNGLGKNSSPTAKEMEFITRWTKEYGFTNDIIFEACERTVLATDNHRFEYAEGILKNWKQENVHHKDDIHKIDDLYQQRRKTKSDSKVLPKSTYNNRFNHFQQHDYDFEAIENDILSN